MSWSYRYYVEPEVGDTQVPVALGIGDEFANQGQDVPVIDRNGRRRVAPELWECVNKSVFDRLRRRRESVAMELRFYRQIPGGLPREDRPRKKAGWELAQAAIALKAAKQAAGAPSPDTPF